MRTIKCLKLEMCFDVELTQQGYESFTVRYGKQIKSRLNYSQAAHELGACIMHALACDGKLDNQLKGRKGQSFRFCCGI